MGGVAAVLGVPLGVVGESLGGLGGSAPPKRAWTDGRAAPG